MTSSLHCVEESSERGRIQLVITTNTTTTADPAPQIAAHNRAWSAYVQRIADLEAAKSSYSRADDTYAPGSSELSDAHARITSAKAGVSAARDTLRDTAKSLLIVARVVAAEVNDIGPAAEKHARSQWEKLSVGARLYATTLREADYYASPWRQALPHDIPYVEFPARIEDLHDLGPEFAARVINTFHKLTQLRAAVVNLNAIKS